MHFHWIKICFFQKIEQILIIKISDKKDKLTNEKRK